MTKPKGNILGHIDCPTCGYAEMQVKADKNGNAYGWCPDCTQQLLTHGGEKDAALRKRMRPVSVSVPEQEPEPASTPVQEPPTEAPAPAPKPTPAPTQAPAKPQEKASWFSPVLSKGKTPA